MKKYIKNFENLAIKNNFTAAIIIPDKDIIPGAETLSPAYLIFENYEKILNWNRSLRFALAVCTLKEKFTMKYKILIILFFLFSCSAQLTTLNKNVPYSANGFAYIYNDNDFNEKIIKGKMDNKILQISHQNLKTGSLLKLPIQKIKESYFKKYKKN